MTTSWPFQALFHNPIFPDMNLSQSFSKYFNPKLKMVEEKQPNNSLNLNDFTLESGLEKAPQPAKKRRYACSQCPYSTDRRDLFRRHENIHRDEKPFRCYICNKMFNRADHVKKHFLRIHKGLEYDVKLTKRVKGIDYEVPESNSNVKNNTSTDILNSSNAINSESKLAKVLTNLNPPSCESQTSKSQVSSKKLDWLNRLNPVKVNYQENQVLCEYKKLKESNQSEKIDDQQTSDVKYRSQEYECEFCKCAFVNYPSLHNHRYMLHQYATNYDNCYPQNCIICGKKNSTQKLMIEHMLLHSNQTNYKIFDKADSTIEKEVNLKERKSKRKQMRPKKIIKSLEYVQVEESNDYEMLNVCKICQKNFFTNVQLKQHQYFFKHY